MLTGFWHGASWNFVLWGLYYLVFLILEKYVIKDLMERMPAVLRHIVTLFIIMVGWLLFYFEDLSALGRMLTNSLN